MTDDELSQEPHEGLSPYRDELRIAVGHLSPEGFRSGLLWTAEEYEDSDRVDSVPRAPGETLLMLGFATDRQIAALTREDLAELLQHEDGEVRMAALQVTARVARMNPS